MLAAKIEGKGKRVVNRIQAAFVVSSPIATAISVFPDSSSGLTGLGFVQL
jgi:hypothetical protein